MASYNDSGIPYVPISIGHQNYSYYNLTYGHLNITDPWTQCTPTLCSLLLANFQYLPNIPGNAFLLSFYALTILTNIGLGIYFKTWSFMGCMLGGLALEIIGYAGRLMAHNNPFGKGPFLISIICLTVGPTFFAAAIYLCFTWVIYLYGGSRFAPRAYLITFIVFDITALVLQGAGGGIASLAVRGSNTYYQGINVMTGGLIWQVVSLTIFMIMSADFAWTTMKKPSLEKDPPTQKLVASLKWKAFISGLMLATLAIYIRCIYRIIELQAGLDSHLAQDETKFMILEGAIIAISVLSLSVLHPGFMFPKYWGRWDQKVAEVDK